MTATDTALLPTDRVTVTVRVARPDEFESVGELTYLGFGHGEPDSRRPDASRLALLLGAAARAEGGDLLVAERRVAERDPSAIDARTASVPPLLVGTASLLRAGGPLTRQSIDGEAELRLLAVLPEHRRLGAGRALMLASIERARAWGAPALILDTGPQNLRSQRLYESLGFERQPARETKPASVGGFLAVYRLPL